MRGRSASRRHGRSRSHGESGSCRSGESELGDFELAAPSKSGRAAAIKEAFDRLPPAMRATAVLRLYVGLSEEETAETLDCSVGTVKSNLHDARNGSRPRLPSGVAPTVGEPSRRSDARRRRAARVRRAGGGSAGARRAARASPNDAERRFRAGDAGCGGRSPPLSQRGAPRKRARVRARGLVDAERRAADPQPGSGSCPSAAGRSSARSSRRRRAAVVRDRVERPAPRLGRGSSGSADVLRLSVRDARDPPRAGGARRELPPRGVHAASDASFPRRKLPLGYETPLRECRRVPTARGRSARLVPAARGRRRAQRHRGVYFGASARRRRRSSRHRGSSTGWWSARRARPHGSSSGRCRSAGRLPARPRHEGPGPDVRLQPEGLRRHWGPQPPRDPTATFIAPDTRAISTSGSGAWSLNESLVFARTRPNPGGHRLAGAARQPGVYAHARRCAPARARIPLRRAASPGRRRSGGRSWTADSAGASSSTSGRCRAVLRGWRRADGSYAGIAPTSSNRSSQ